MEIILSSQNKWKCRSNDTCTYLTQVHSCLLTSVSTFVLFLSLLLSLFIVLLFLPEPLESKLHMSLLFILKYVCVFSKTQDILYKPVLLTPFILTDTVLHLPYCLYSHYLNYSKIFFIAYSLSPVQDPVHDQILQLLSHLFSLPPNTFFVFYDIDFL